MTGWRFVAWTSAYAMRWVKETFSRRPVAWMAALIRRRRSSSAPTGTTRKVVAVGTVRLCSMLATSLAAGPLMGLAPAGGAWLEAAVSAAAVSGRLAVPPFRRSADPPFGAGRSPTMPLSNRRRHSGPTAEGSRRNSSYMACAKPALAVSNTLGSTKFTVG
jgi:hypothetical protein